MKIGSSSSDDSDWLSRLTNGLSRSSQKLGQSINDLFTQKKLNDETITELEDILITSDLGFTTASNLTKKIRSLKFNQEITVDEVKATLAAEISKTIEPFTQPIKINIEFSPHVILVCGVNGVGKTTTIGKLAQTYSVEGKTVCLAACDTFRAAAIEQLEIWGNRANCHVFSSKTGKDPASLAFDALKHSQDIGADILIIDTAGRLHNKKELMDELEKIIRVIKKINSDAPHDRILVLDATTGQNAHSQVEAFLDIIDISGLILTKLDGSSKGGVLVSLTEKFGLPVHAIGVGESVEDLRPFDPDDFSNSLLGIDSSK